MSSAISAAASATSSAAGGIPPLPSSCKIVGIGLAILPGGYWDFSGLVDLECLLISSSFMFKKKGLFRLRLAISWEKGLPISNHAVPTHTNVVDSPILEFKGGTSYFL
ncbi:hypothetical protein BU17DRAFT_64234 [Hysterangium stoloniferum]|nr:hypothetical protein BU17DRAFT_64234 [Hysterangium stoloniferum]